ncbi:MAG: cupin domain-containing protein [Kiloniellaceae bacterium]
MSANDEKERAKARSGDKSCSFYRDALKASAESRRDYQSGLNVVKAAQMPFERSPDGLIKHIIHEKLGTKESCIEAYMQFLEPGKASGKHRHLSEEIVYVVEGRGYDLHWDVKFDCQDAFEWEWEDEPRKFEWAQGDFIYVPPYCIHQHVNADSENEARIIVINNRIIKDMGFDWFEQLENAEGF